MSEDIKDIIKNFKMTRYEDMPSFELYVDQLITIAENELKPLSYVYSYQNITPSMVNNYVKQKVIDKPVKKKYTRDQLAKLILVTALKSVFSIGEIGEAIKYICEKENFGQMYNKFCDYFEISLKKLFLEEDFHIDLKDSIYIVTNTISSKLYLQTTLLKIRGSENE